MQLLEIYISFASESRDGVTTSTNKLYCWLISQSLKDEWMPLINLQVVLYNYTVHKKAFNVGAISVSLQQEYKLCIIMYCIVVGDVSICLS